MLRYDRQTKPGLVALYDIWPGNGAVPFLRKRSGSILKTPEPARGILRYNTYKNVCLLSKNLKKTLNIKYRHTQYMFRW